MLYLGMAGLILIGIVVQRMLIGPSLFATTHWGSSAHVFLGALIFLSTLLLPVPGRLSRLPDRVVLRSAGLFGLTLLKVTSTSLGRRSLFLAALHPAIALLMAGLTVLLLTQGWQLMRDRSCG